jgi:flavoprotein
MQVNGNPMLSISFSFNRIKLKMKEIDIEKLEGLKAVQKNTVVQNPKELRQIYN